MIRIVDDFFDKKSLKEFQNFCASNIKYEPKYFVGTTEKIEKNYYGMRYELHNNKKLLKLLCHQTEYKFKIKIKKVYDDSGIDMRQLNMFKPHKDASKMNMLFMIDGPVAINNGTVFYTPSNGPDDDAPDRNYEIDMHVGFKPNRAILFPSNKMHSASVSEIKNIKRYTATLFIAEYSF
jgi:hypothetical protein